MGSFSKSYILGACEADLAFSEETKEVKTFEKESPAPRDKKIGLKIYNTIALASQRKLDYETMKWTNNLERLVSEVDIWRQFSGKCANLCELYSVYEQIGEEKVYLEMELGDAGLIATFEEHQRAYTLNPVFEKACSEYFSDLKDPKEQYIRGVQLIFKGLLNGVECLHGLNIVHRDLKI